MNSLDLRALDAHQGSPIEASLERALKRYTLGDREGALKRASETLARFDKLPEPQKAGPRARRSSSRRSKITGPWVERAKALREALSPPR